MVMEASKKIVFRMLKKHLSRFISIIFIVLISIGFVSGVGSSCDVINKSVSDYYISSNVSDLIIKSKSESGFSKQDINKIKNIYGEENVNIGISFDVNIKVNNEEQLTRLYFLDYENWTINTPELLKGNKSLNSVYAERENNRIKGYNIKDEIKLNFNDIFSSLGYNITLPIALEKTISIDGIVLNPLMFSKEGEPSYNNPENINLSGLNINFTTVDNVLYLPMTLVPTMKDISPNYQDIPLIPICDIYVKINNRNLFNSFSKDYKEYIDNQVKMINELFTTENGEETVKILTLNENYSFASLYGYTDKIRLIGIALMFAFIFVTALVVLSNMTRLIEEERGQIACLRTLGYSSFNIIFKYIFFSLIATLIGGFFAYFVGMGLAYLIAYVFNFCFVMPSFTSSISSAFYFLTLAVIFLSTLIATLFSGYKINKETPANLLRPKSPKVGKSTLLEKIPFIWKKLPFRYKSTIRNVARFKSRFLMAVISIAISTGLVMAGLGLFDMCLFGNLNSPSIKAIALVVILFAGLLTIIVIYTLTSINISERNRELATLMVLGYHDKEVVSYIHREIYIDTLVGVIFGYPISIVILLVLYNIIGMGTISEVTWFWWIVTPLIVFFFVFIVDLIQHKKIVNIQMNESLKAVE